MSKSKYFGHAKSNHFFFKKVEKFNFCSTNNPLFVDHHIVEIDRQIQTKKIGKIDKMKF